MSAPAGQLMISGTAAIVGHASQHPDDPLRQLDETMRNVARLLELAGRTGLDNGSPLVKLYLRRPSVWPAIEASFAADFAHCETLVLAGDVCRRELLLEKGIWG